MAVSVFVAVLLLNLLKVLFKEASKAGILVSFILFLFYFYEAIQAGIAGYVLGDIVLRHDPNLFWSYGVIFTLFTFGLLFWDEKFKKTTEFLNVMSVVLIAFPLYGFVSHKIASPGGDLFSPTQADQAAIPDNFQHTGPKPDIYYIILDGYLRDDVMNKYWDFDNSEFINFLTNTGFYVAPKSRSNYPNTGFSLASSLNMEYLPINLQVDTARNFNNIPFIEAIRDNRVVSFLKSMGYLYVHLSDDAAESKMAGQADIVITNRNYVSLFSQYLLNKTILKNLKFDSLNAIQTKKENIIYGFKELEKIPENDKPTFTFAHFLMPHGPQAFDKNGNSPTQSDNSPDKYFGEILYANKKIRYLVNHILANSETPPIILIQGDHGYLVASSNRPDAEQAKKSFSNLNAYFIPGKEKLYETISPVNSFRWIFDHYFGTKFGLLEDKSYFPVTYTKMRKFISVPSEDLLNNGSIAWVNSLEQDILKNPDFPEAHAMLGTYYALLERFPEATASVERALRLNPDLIWAHINLAMIYLRKGDTSMALEAIHQAILINPNLADAHTISGDIQMDSGNYNEAISAFNKALNKAPDDTEIINRIARAYYLLNNKEKSLLNFQKAVLISGSYNNYHDLGVAYSKYGLNKEAISNLEKAVQINPSIAEAYYNLGNLYLKENNQLESIKNFKKAITLDSERMLAHFGLGNAYLKSNQLEAALIEFKVAINLNSDHILSYVNLGYTQIQLGQIDQARKTYESALLIKQPRLLKHFEFAEIHKNLGIIYSEESKDPAKAILHFQESIRLAPSQPDSSQIQSMIKDLKR